jgi:RNA polymerase sigma-70 factor (ECF subfamily)
MAEYPGCLPPPWVEALVSPFISGCKALPDPTSLLRVPDPTHRALPGDPTRARPRDPEREALLEVERGEVERAQRGDRAALAAILRRHGPVLYRAVLLPRLGSQAAAEEALSIIYTKVIERLGQFQWQGVGVYPWLRMVALRVALDALRARKREIPFETDALAREVERAERGAGQEADAETLAQQDAEAARARLDQALATINPRYARAIRLRILEERTRDEVAQDLGVTTATFDVVLHRALAALKKALGAANKEEEA